MSEANEMTRAKAVQAADAAAQGAWLMVAEQPPKKKWWHMLGDMKPRELANTMIGPRGLLQISPEALYRYAVGEKIDTLPWGALLELQVAVETFHAVVRTQLERAFAIENAARPQPDYRPRFRPERTWDDRADGPFDRVDLKEKV